MNTNSECGIRNAELPPAIVLLGPTGSGKTPLGEMLRERGLWGRPCLHFDFGAAMRDLVTCNQPDPWVTREDLAFLADVLRTGALLEDSEFPLAQRILRSFLERNRADPNVLVVLNGLPRHAGQAEALRPLLAVCAVVNLQCTAETVFERIGRDAGGDRSGRVDDAPDLLRRKLEIFRRRTLPLVEHYRAAGVPIFEIGVGPDTQAEPVHRELQAWRPRGAGWQPAPPAPTLPF